MRDADYDQDGALSAWGLAYCIKILRRLSFGFSLNFWEDGIYENKWKQTIVEKGTGTSNGNNFTFERRSVDDFFSADLMPTWASCGM
jgi:hypothetical protein